MSDLAILSVDQICQMVSLSLQGQHEVEADMVVQDL